LPGLDAILELLGEYVRVCGSLENLLHDFAGNLVLAVAVGDSAYKCGGKYLGTLTTNCEHCIVFLDVMSSFVN
jgi:hypothetical protein